MNINDVKIFSFFAGAGFLDLGFEKTGFDVAFVNEFYKPFLDAYRYSRKQMNIEEPEYGYYNGDIVDLLNNKHEEFEQKINALRNQKKIIGFIGGPPCPDFSVGGKNRGRDGENGKLSSTYIDLICQQEPDFFLFENVKGLWRTKIHREFFDELKKRVHDNGYITSERLINAIEYGAPQDRERIIFVGFKNDFLKQLGYNIEDRQFVLENFPWMSEIKYSKEDLMNKSWPESHAFSENSVSECPDNIPEELTVEFWFRKNQVLNHPNAKDFFQPKAGLAKMLKVYEGDDSKKSYKRLHRWRYSPTAAYGNNEVHLHPYKARRISAAEALAIQSLPIEFTLPPNMTLTDKFKTVGNGVPYVAAKGLAKTILNFIGGENNGINSCKYYSCD